MTALWIGIGGYALGVIFGCIGMAFLSADRGKDENEESSEDAYLAKMAQQAKANPAARGWRK